MAQTAPSIDQGGE